MPADDTSRDVSYSLKTTLARHPSPLSVDVLVGVAAVVILAVLRGLRFTQSSVGINEKILERNRYLLFCDIQAVIKVYALTKICQGFYRNPKRPLGVG